MNSAYRTRLVQQLRLYSKIRISLDGNLSRDCLAYLFLLHLVSGIQQASKGDLTLGEFVESVRGKYKDELVECIPLLPEFFRNERATFAGRIRFRLFLGLLQHGYPGLGGRLMGLKG